VAKEMSERSAIQEPDVEKPVEDLSGGNQQKVMFARCLISHPDVLILDEPARGVDVGAMKSIFESVVSLTEDGRAVIMISSDLEELMNMCHRIYVMREGEVVAEMMREFEERPILAAAFGQVPAASTVGGKERS
jgi:ABC-type sugar transport system ATPase subunit